MRSKSFLLAAMVILAVFSLSRTASAFYLPGLGRFAQRDPLAYFDGMNLTEYEKGRPISLIDDYGTDSGEPWVGNSWNSSLYENQLKCCACLIMGEAGGETKDCKRAVAWTARNRRDLSTDGAWPSFRNEIDPGAQSNKGKKTFEGGKGNPHYDKCFANWDKCLGKKDPFTPIERKAMADASDECNDAISGGSADPTNGAQYWFASNAVPEYMKKAIAKGICNYTGPNGCGNVFVKCKHEPLASELK